MKESSGLLLIASSKPPRSKSRFRNSKAGLRSCCSSRICIGNKAANMILLWNFSVLLIYQAFYNTTSFVQVSQATSIPLILNVVLFVVAVLSPLAGVLTDVKFSRFKTLLCSSYGLLIQSVIGLLAVVGYFASISSALKRGPVYEPFVQDKGILFVLAVAFTVIFGGSVLITNILFIINGVQFGMDQLHDSPTKDSILFIYWYVWLNYSSAFVSEALWNLMFYDSMWVNNYNTMRRVGTPLGILTIIAAISILIFSVCMSQHRKAWFHVEPAGFNPYKLVYRVCKFAYQHKVPLKRSAFTYNDDELPSRMDLGKYKYGGPFTTKEVEDVKAFWGILKVLICIGPSFMLQMVIQLVPPLFSRHGNSYYKPIFYYNQSIYNEVHLENTFQHIFISNGLLSPLLVVVFIPLYLCFVQPFIAFRIPGILKRIGLGILLMLLSLLCTLAMDLVVHKQLHDVTCMLTSYTNFSELIPTDHFNNIVNANTTIPGLFVNIYFLTSQHFLSALLNIVFDIAVLEFVCSQSPYSMKGLLLGLLYTIRYLFQTIAILSMLPFGLLAEHLKPFSCGSSYYLMNILLGILVIVVFMCMAKRYRYRIINEPSNEYRYAEEYFSKSISN